MRMPEVLLKRPWDAMSRVLSSCFPSEAMQFQEEVIDGKGLQLAWHFNLCLKNKPKRLTLPTRGPFSFKKDQKKKKKEGGCFPGQ